MLWVISQTKSASFFVVVIVIIIVCKLVCVGRIRTLPLNVCIHERKQTNNFEFAFQSSLADIENISMWPKNVATFYIIGSWCFHLASFIAAFIWLLCRLLVEVNNMYIYLYVCILHYNPKVIKILPCLGEIGSIRMLFNMVLITIMNGAFVILCFKLRSNCFFFCLMLYIRY